MDYPFRLPFGHPFRNAFSLPGFGQAIPPVSDNLLVWLKGLNTSDETAKLDSWAKPGRESMVLTHSACIEFDGVAEYGTLDTAITLSSDFEISWSAEAAETDDGYIVGNASGDDFGVQYNTTYIRVKDNGINRSFTSVPLTDKNYTLAVTGLEITVTSDTASETLPYSGDPFVVGKVGTKQSNVAYVFGGKLWNLRLKDATQDIHFPIAEVNGLYSWDTTGTHRITWTPGAGGVAGMRAARQDSGFNYNANFGYGKGENLLKTSKITLANMTYGANANPTIVGDGVLVDVVDSFAAYTNDGSSPGSIFNTDDRVTYGFLLRLPDGESGSVFIHDAGGYTSSGVTVTATNELEWYYKQATVSSDNKPVLPAIRYTSGVAPQVIIADMMVFRGHEEAGEYIETTGVPFDGTEYLPFLNTMPAGTMNYPESLMAFEEKPVGSPNGTTDAFVMLADHGTIVSSAGTSTPTYVHPDISLTAGWIRNILFSDGTLVKVDEGSGTDIHDSDGNLVGTLTTGDSVAFWTDASPMVSQAVMDMEADQGVGVFTDLAGHSVPMSQATIDTVVDLNDQYFRKNCVGSNTEYFFYKTQLTGSDLGEALVHCCLVENITFDSAKLTFDTLNTYMRT
jgi:hypothetical protein